MTQTLPNHYRDTLMPHPDTHAEGPKIYQAGTLTYTKGGLMALSTWLLFGDFALTFFEQVFGRYIPIYLKDLQASNTLIGLMTGSFAGLVNVFFLPGISRWSDEFRSSIGRRIPFLYVVAPLTVLSVVGVGFAPELGRWLHAHLPAQLSESVSESVFVLALLCVLTVSFHFFNMVLINAYNWLLRDVVPLVVMSRFLAWFSIVGTASTTLFLWFVFPHFATHRWQIFLGVGVFYLVAFMMMCLKVKEGEYPAPTPRDDRPGFFKTFAVYFRECLQVPIYRHFFLLYLLITVALTCANSFITLFASSTLGIDLGDIGHVFAWSSGISLLFFYPLGWLCDRYSPLHVTLGAIIGMLAGSILALVLIQTKAAFLTYSIAISLPTVAWYLGQKAMSMKLFPSEKFGQFSGGLNVFGCGALIVGNILIGVLMDVSESNYRLAFLWTAILCAAAIFPMVIVIREWRRLGGHDNYDAPLPK